MIKNIVKIGVLLLLIPLASAQSLDIYYPNNNTITDIYYANSTGYYSNQSNTLDTIDVNIVILKDQIVTETNLLNDSKPLYRSMLTVFWIIVMGFVLIIMVKVVKGVLR